MNELELYRAQTRCISHEIRNHLSICELYSEIIKKRLDKDGIKNESVENAIACIQKSLKIIGYSLLDLKSLNTYTPSRYDLKKLLENAADMAAAYVHDKKIVIKKELCENIFVETDENKFLACIVNILKNAVEAIDSTGEIHIKSYKDGKKAHIIFSNNGRPISEEKQKQIFDEGFTTKATGSGLGLHICRNNLAAQNAELRLNKSDTISTEFEIIIPVI